VKREGRTKAREGKGKGKGKGKGDGGKRRNPCNEAH